VKTIIESISINKKTILAGGLGIFIILIGTIRWLFMFPDYSQFFLSFFIGAILIYIGYDQDYKTMNDKKLERFGYRLDSHLASKGGVIE